MSDVDKLFQRLGSKDEKAFMPFITAGDPSLEFTAECLLALNKAGCHMVELGIPYSDPIADGPVIQASYTRALNDGVKLENIFEMVEAVAPKLEMPIVVMVSFAIIFRKGIEPFVQKASQVGISGAIVPDLPVDESEELARVCAKYDFSLIQLITPTTSKERQTKIADTSTGFIYYVSVTGITGERTELPPDVAGNLKALKAQTNTPVCIGFGISRPEQATSLRTEVDGMIVGSAIVRRIESHSQGSDQESVLADISQFAKAMLAAINPLR